MARDPQIALESYCEHAAHELISMRRARLMIESVREREPAFANTGNAEFLGGLRAWLSADALLSAARAFDSDTRTASVRCAVAYVQSATRRIADGMCDEHRTYLDAEGPGGHRPAASSGLDARLVRYRIHCDTHATDVSSLLPKVAAIGSHLSNALVSLEAQLSRINTYRNTVLAHRQRDPPPKPKVRWPELVAIEQFILMFLDCAQPMFKGGGVIFVDRGEFAVLGWQRAASGLSQLLELAEAGLNSARELTAAHPSTVD